MNNKSINNKKMEHINKDNSNLDNDKTLVNYVCICNKNFKAGDVILYVTPCCHMFHEKCLNNNILETQIKNNNINNKLANCDILNCPICNTKIVTILNEQKINSKEKYKKYQIDILSVKLDNSATINYLTLPLSIVKITSMINKLISAQTERDIVYAVEFALKGLNVKINIIDNTKKNNIIIKNNYITWKNKNDINKKKVIICNHSHYLDTFILYYMFRCGFVAGDFINSFDLGRLLVTKCKMLIFKRGVDTNMVDKIKEYLKKENQIIIFPEGALANNNTLMRFRTGSFYTGAYICPVVIKYKNFTYDDDLKTVILKLVSQNEISVDVYINDFEKPPFTEESIELVRDKMAKIGNLQKSRVSNKNIKE